MKDWRIDRRMFLRGVGAAVALPMLDAMVPSMARATRAASAGAAGAGKLAGGFPKRMAWVYVPNGKNMEDWTPDTTGPNYDMKMILQPLAAHKKDFTLISGMAHKSADAMGDGGGGHARAAATFLTGHHPRKTSGANISSATSVDQVAANANGSQTRLPSLELTCDRGQAVGQCESGYSCTYQFNLSWRSETQPMTPEVDPKLVFERLFGAGTPEAKAQQAKRDRYNTSILDIVAEDARGLQTRLGVGDKRKMDEYLTSIRDVERRIQSDSKFDIVVPSAGEAPVIPDDYDYREHLRLMYDMMTLGFQTDSTRIITFIAAHDGSNRPYPQAGVADGHHDLSHHRNEQAKKALLAKINTFHTTQFAYFLAKLKSIKEGEGNLLDNCMIVYGSGLSDGNSHSNRNLPVILAGGGGGTIKTVGNHIRVKEETSMCNLYLSMLDRVGVHQDRLGDSTGKLAELDKA